MSAAEVTIEEWLEVWGGVVGRARKMDDLPMWLQFYPKTLFDTINRSGSGVITKQELNLFYTAFLGTNKQQLDSRQLSCRFPDVLGFTSFHSPQILQEIVVPSPSLQSPFPRNISPLFTHSHIESCI